MDNKHPSVREVVDHGLEQIPPDRTVSVPVRELVRLFKIFEELNAFFHQPTHYPDVEAVHAFLGTRTDGGAYGLIADCLYETLPRLLPDDVLRTIESGELEHPAPLAYRHP